MSERGKNREGGEMGSPCQGGRVERKGTVQKIKVKKLWEEGDGWLKFLITTRTSGLRK